VGSPSAIDSALNRAGETVAAASPPLVATSPPVIHAVTTDELVSRPDFVDRAAGVMWALGARGAVHVRAPGLTGRRLYDLTAALVPFQRTTGAWVVVNDRVDVALAAEARGVQLTSRSLSVADAMHAIRAAASGTQVPAVGASIHTVDEAREAALQVGLDWLVAGHVFNTPSHDGEAPRGMSFLADACAAVSLPVIAIGGVQPEDISGLLARGAFGIAVIRGIWYADDAAAAAREYLSAYDAARAASASGRA
jgi:thiamine-phosphate diphosphorylase